MPTERYELMLDAMLDGTLSDEDRRALEAYARQDAAFAKRLEANRALADIINNIPEEAEVPAKVSTAWQEAVHFENILDAMLDGTASDEDRCAAEDYANRTPDYARRLEANRALKAAFTQIPREVEVPFKAGAQWRKAIREEAAAQKRKKLQRLYRRIGAAAAAVIVLIGAGLFLKPQQQISNNTVAVEYDSAAASDLALTAPDLTWEMTADPEEALSVLQDLAEEYTGKIEALASGNGMTVRVTLPSDMLEDFISAASYLDRAENMPETVELSKPTVDLLICIAAD